MAEEQVLNTHNAEILLSAANKSHDRMLVSQALSIHFLVVKTSPVLLGNLGKHNCLTSITLTISYALWMCQVTVMPVCPKKNVPNGGK